MFENVHLFAFALKFAKRALMTPKKNFGKNINMGIKTQNFMLVSNWLMSAFKNAPKIS